MPEAPTAVAEAARRRQTLAGIAWVLLGTFAFTLITASAKLVGLDAEVSALQIIFLRFVGGTATALALAVGRGQLRSAFQTTRMDLHGWRAFVAAGGVGASLYAATHLPLVEAGAIGLTQGIFVLLLAAAVLGERVGPAHWRAMAVCLAGALMVVFGKQGLVMPKGEALPVAMALAGALLVSVELILIKRLAGTEPPLTVMLYVNLLGGLLLAGPAFWLWQGLRPGEIVLLLGLGPLAILAQYCNIQGFKRAEASLLSPVGYSRLIFAGLLGFVFFGELPGVATLAGAAVLVLGGLMLTRLHTRPG